MHKLLSMGGLGAPEIILLMIPLSYFALIAYCLVDILRSDFKDSTNKLIWVLVVLLAPFLGSILYLAIGRNSKVA
jgi:hypothetical protein